MDEEAVCLYADTITDDACGRTSEWTVTVRFGSGGWAKVPLCSKHRAIHNAKSAKMRAVPKPPQASTTNRRY